MTPESITVRIIREKANRDGWITRNLSTNRVGYIQNLTDTITELSPGQVWESRISRSFSSFDLVILDNLITH